MRCFGCTLPALSVAWLTSVRCPAGNCRQRFHGVEPVILLQAPPAMWRFSAPRQTPRACAWHSGGS